MREAHAELEEETVEINLVPYMDIVTNIIIFLLASVVNAIPLGNVNVSLPAIGDGVASEQTDQPEKPPLNLTITAGERGFLIAASGGVLPTVPKKGDKYDFKQLTTKLEEIKKEYPDETQVKFNADATIPYRTVIETLDAMRMDAKGNMLFPDVNFAAGIL
jgi:biopolymer transport protein ExbD